MWLTKNFMDIVDVRQTSKRPFPSLFSLIQRTYCGIQLLGPKNHRKFKETFKPLLPHRPPVSLSSTPISSPAPSTRHIQPSPPPPFLSLCPLRNAWCVCVSGVVTAQILWRSGHIPFIIAPSRIWGCAWPSPLNEGLG